jgi:hypothetical protein
LRLLRCYNTLRKIGKRQFLTAELKFQGIAVKKDTSYMYLSYLEDTFLLRSKAIATDSERRGREESIQACTSFDQPATLARGIRALYDA